MFEYSFFYFHMEQPILSSIFIWNNQYHFLGLTAMPFGLLLYSTSACMKLPRLHFLVPHTLNSHRIIER
jgi:hypothetical protein